MWAGVHCVKYAVQSPGHVKCRVLPTPPQTAFSPPALSQAHEHGQICQTAISLCYVSPSVINTMIKSTMAKVFNPILQFM